MSTPHDFSAPGSQAFIPKGRDYAKHIQKLHAEDSSADARQVAGTHYVEMGVQPWDVVDTWPIEQQIGAYRHGALKYLMRMGSKDEQLQEIRKCGHYIQKLIEVLEHASTSAQKGTGTKAA